MKFISQTEQAGGYWLIVVQLANNAKLPFGYSQIVNNFTWVLFSQTKKNANFLSRHKYQKTQNSKKNNPQKILPPPPLWGLLSAEKEHLKKNKIYLLLASDLKMAAAFHLLKELKNKHQFIVILHATDSFPFIVKPAQIMFHNFPHEAIGSCPLLEDWKLVNRLCSSQGLPGCFDGDFTELLKVWTPPTNWEVLHFE